MQLPSMGTLPQAKWSCGPQGPNIPEKKGPTGTPSLHDHPLSTITQQGPQARCREAGVAETGSLTSHSPWATSRACLWPGMDLSCLFLFLSSLRSNMSGPGSKAEFMPQEKPSLCEDENEGWKNWRQRGPSVSHFTVSEGLLQDMCQRQK